MPIAFDTHLLHLIRETRLSFFTRHLPFTTTATEKNVIGHSVRSDKSCFKLHRHQQCYKRSITATTTDKTPQKSPTPQSVSQMQFSN